MNVVQLVEKLQALQGQIGGDPEVIVQCHGCCVHGHAIQVVQAGEPVYEGRPTDDEVGAIVVRV